MPKKAVKYSLADMVRVARARDEHGNEMFHVTIKRQFVDTLSRDTKFLDVSDKKFAKKIKNLIKMGFESEHRKVRDSTMDAVDEFVRDLECGVTAFYYEQSTKPC